MNQIRSMADNAMREAADRIARAHARGLRPEDDLSLNVWRRENEANEQAFRHVVQTWHDVSLLRDTPGYTNLLGSPTWRERWIELRQRLRSLLSSPPRISRTMAFASILIFALAAAGLALSFLDNPDYATRVAQIREIPLDDGTVVTLGAKSALDIQFTQDTRRIELGSGEAFFAVAKDAQRPFLVVAGETVIRVVGTRFNVNTDKDRVRVSVQEGVVEVLEAGTRVSRLSDDRSSPVALRLAAGQQAIVQNGAGLPKAELFRGSEPGDWRQGRLSYRDTTLAEIVSDANRYRKGTIRIVSPELEDQRITTSFRTTQIEQMLETLPDMLPVLVMSRTDGGIDLISRPVH